MNRHSEHLEIVKLTGDTMTLKNTSISLRWENDLTKLFSDSEPSKYQSSVLSELDTWI